MPDRSYYLDDTPRLNTIRAAYLKHSRPCSSWRRRRSRCARGPAPSRWRRRFAESHATRHAIRRRLKANNPVARDFQCEGRRGSIGIPSSPRPSWTNRRSFIVWHPHAVTGLAALVKSEPLQSWKDYLTYGPSTTARASCPKPRGRVLLLLRKDHQGGGGPAARWRRALDVTNEALPQTVGKVYSAKYFRPRPSLRWSPWVADLVRLQSAHRRLSWMRRRPGQGEGQAYDLEGQRGLPQCLARRLGAGVVRGDALVISSGRSFRIIGATCRSWAAPSIARSGPCRRSW